MATLAPSGAQPLLARSLAHWPLFAGFALLLVPTVATLGREVWTLEIGAHGPIVLATGLWLLWQQLPAMRAAAAPAAVWSVALPAVPALALYAFGRAYDFIFLEAAGLYVLMLAMAAMLAGWRAIAANWFPFLYLGFLVPPPGWAIDRFTGPLRLFVSYVATTGLSWAGIPISRDGVTLTVAQYQLLVEDACSGLNSIIGLTAISLFYIYLMHRASWRYAALLVAFILPIAIIANIIRISILVLLTYHYGDAVAQGFLHMTAGMILFMVALLLVFALDRVLQPLVMGRGTPEAGR